MIIKFNCHSSFGVDGKHYLLKFISRQARILSSSFKSDAWIANDRVVRARHHQASPLFVTVPRQFARGIPADAVGPLQRAAVFPGASRAKAARRCPPCCLLAPPSRARRPWGKERADPVRDPLCAARRQRAMCQVPGAVQVEPKALSLPLFF